MNNRIILTGIPIPPTSNHQYATVIRGGKTIRFPSKSAKDYKVSFNLWALTHTRTLREASETINIWKCGIEVAMYIALNKQRLISKENNFKRLDASNRCKALHDLLAESLGVDDSCFVSVPIEKVLTDSKEQVVVVIRPFYLRNLEDIGLFKDLKTTGDS